MIKKFSLKLPRILKQRRFWIVFLIFLYLLPVWLFKYFPTQDGPAHLYNAQILREYASSDFFRQYFDLRLALFPNWLSFLVEWGLLYIFPALVSEKILLSFYIILFPLGFFYFLDAVQPGRNLIGFLSFLFIYNFLFLMGFYNFVLTIPLFLFLVGYWLKNKDHLGWKHGLICNLLLLLIFFGHLVSYVLAIGFLGLLSLLFFRKKVRPILLTMACVLPSTLLFINYYIGSGVSETIKPVWDMAHIADLFTRLVELKLLVSYTDFQQWIAGGTAIITLFLLVYTIWKDLLEARSKVQNNHNYRIYILVLFIISLTLYLMMPDSIGPGGWLNDRLGLLALLLLLTLLRIGEGRRWRWLYGVIGGLVIINVLYLGFEIRALNRGLEEFVSGVSQVQSHKIILPFSFIPNGESRRIGIYVNASNYYGLDKENVNLGNYEVQFDYFPVTMKLGFQPPIKDALWVEKVHWNFNEIDLCSYASQVDYILTWGINDTKVLWGLTDCYLPVYNKGRLALYIPKP